MLQRRPALRFVLLFAAGILIAACIPLSGLYLFVLTGLVIFISAIFLLGNTWQSIGTMSLHGSVMLLGLLYQTIQKSGSRLRELEPMASDESIRLSGTIDSDPTKDERKMSCVIRTVWIMRNHHIEGEERRLMVFVRLKKGEKGAENIHLGREIELRGIIEPFPFQRNPGEFDYGKYLLLNDIHGIVSVNGLQNIKIGAYVEGSLLRSWTYRVQQTLYRILDSLHSPRHAGFLKGIIFGYRSEIPPDVKQSFMDTGTIHILAVSGSNVAFVAFMFFSLFGFLRLPRKALGGVTVLGLLAYMLITGSSPSVVRATIMAIVLLCGSLVERKTDIYNSISIAALILLVWNSNTLFDVGFQLSFSAVVSIVYFYPKLEFLIKKIPDRFEEIKVFDTTMKLFAVSLAAQLGTIPFTAYYFNRISVVSFLANIPVVPISGLNTFIGFAEVLSFPVCRWIAGLFAAANDFLIWFLLGFVKHAASVPFAYVEAWSLSTFVILGYYVLLFGVFNIHQPRVRAQFAIWVLILTNSISISELWYSMHPKLNVSIIDVGQGDAILLEFPDGKRMLIDAGPLSQRYNAGERIIAPFLKRKGITRLEYFLITHSHSDHLGGARALLRSMMVDTIVMSPFRGSSYQVRSVLQAAEEKNVGQKVLRAGNQITLDPRIRVYCLYPEVGAAKIKNLNNSSIVLKVVYGCSSILLVGDAEAVDENKMVHRYDDFLMSDILKVGHHGSHSSTSEEFLNIVHPQKALVSVGIHNRFSHPSPITMQRLAAHSIEINRTDKKGAIIFESDGSAWKQER